MNTQRYSQYLSLRALVLTHSSCSGVSNCGKPRMLAKNTPMTSPILQVMRKLMKACMFAYMQRPSSTASTIVEKLSSTGNGKRSVEPGQDKRHATH